MKTSKRIIISLILVSIGIVLILASLSLSAFFGDGLTFGTESFTKIIENNVKTIDINYASCKIVIEEGDEFKLVAKNIKKNSMDYSIDGGSLKVSMKSSIFNMINFNNTASIKLYVPKDVILNTVDLDCGAGVISVSNIKSDLISLKGGVGLSEIENIVADSITIEGGVGKIVAENVSSHDIKISGGVGQIEFDGEVLGDCDIVSGIGEVSFTTNTPKSDFNFDLSNGIGDLTINDMSYHDFDNNTNGKYKMKIDNGIGEIKLFFE